MEVTEKMRRYRADWVDLGLTKFAVFLVTLMAAKWWPILTSLPWFCYATAGVLVSARPMVNFMKTAGGK